MRLVLADVQQDALKQTEVSATALGADVMSHVCDVRRGDEVESLAQAAVKRFGAIHVVFNNAGVGAGGLIWESTQQDWEWVLGVNLWGVIHGVRVFTPLMLASAKADPNFEGHIINTASMAGLLTPPAMGIYNVSKHAVVALTETLYHDLSLIMRRSACRCCARILYRPVSATPTVCVRQTRKRQRNQHAASRYHKPCWRKRSAPAR